MRDARYARQDGKDPDTFTAVVRVVRDGTPGGADLIRARRFARAADCHTIVKFFADNTKAVHCQHDSAFVKPSIPSDTSHSRGTIGKCRPCGTRSGILSFEV